MEIGRLRDIIEEADRERLKRALVGLSDGRYRVSDLEYKRGEVRAYVSNEDGKDYGVAINESEVFCHCPDYFFTNEGICKHILMLSFAVLSKTHHELNESFREIKKKKGDKPVGKMKDLRIEIEEGVYELENLESELASISYEIKFLEDRKQAVEKELEVLRDKFGFYKIFQERGRLKRESS